MNYVTENIIQETANNPAWYRARIAAINKLLDELPKTEEKNSPRVLLRNGLIPDVLQKRFNEILDYEYKLTFALNSPLTLREITSFNTWFALHPEKICGKEVVTTSLQFPITVEGSKDDIIRCIHGDEPFEQAEKEPVEPASEPEKKNRFGDAARLLDWLVCDFHGYYHDQVEVFNQENQPLNDQIQTLEQEFKDAGRDRKKRKEVNEKLSEVSGKYHRERRRFEDDWINFCLALRQIIIDKAQSLGIVINEDEGYYIPDDILLAITDRPGIEHYWHDKIGAVIDKELEYYKNISDKNRVSHSEDLELEALALEVELQLLKT